MLDEKDLQAIQGLMQNLLEQSESRMEERIVATESRLEERIAATESRMEERIAATESRLEERIEATESKIMAYIESNVMPRFDILADGHQLLRETLAPKSRVEELEEEVAFLKPLVMSMLTDIDKLKKAQ